MSVPLPNPRRRLEQQDVLTLLTLALVGEAAGEGEPGWRAVAHVIRNRVAAEHGRFGEGWRGVMLRPMQFSCFTDPIGDLLTPLATRVSQETWQAIGKVAEDVFAGDDDGDPTEGAVYYHTAQAPPRVLRWPPKWASSPQVVATVQIGRHQFYREV